MKLGEGASMLLGASGPFITGYAASSLLRKKSDDILGEFATLRSELDQCMRTKYIEQTKQLEQYAKMMEEAGACKVLLVTGNQQKTVLLNKFKELMDTFISNEREEQEIIAKIRTITATDETVNNKSEFLKQEVGSDVMTEAQVNEIHNEILIVRDAIGEAKKELASTNISIKNVQELIRQYNEDIERLEGSIINTKETIESDQQKLDGLAQTVKEVEQIQMELNKVTDETQLEQKKKAARKAITNLLDKTKSNISADIMRIILSDEALIHYVTNDFDSDVVLSEKLISDYRNEELDSSQLFASLNQLGITVDQHLIKAIAEVRQEIHELADMQHFECFEKTFEADDQTAYADLNFLQCAIDTHAVLSILITLIKKIPRFDEQISELDGQLLDTDILKLYMISNNQKAFIVKNERYLKRLNSNKKISE